MNIVLKSFLILSSVSAIATADAPAIKLSDDESVSFARFALVHKLACHENDWEKYLLLFTSVGANNLKSLDSGERERLLRDYPEVESIRLVEELSYEKLLERVGSRTAAAWIGSSAEKARFFSVVFKLKNNGAAPSFVMLRGGVFYKAVQ